MGAGKHIFQDLTMVPLPLLALHAGTTGSFTASVRLPSALRADAHGTFPFPWLRTLASALILAKGKVKQFDYLI